MMCAWKLVDYVHCACRVETQSSTKNEFQIAYSLGRSVIRPQSLQKCGSVGISSSKVLEIVLLRCTSANIDFWAVLTRKIWLRRNYEVFGGVLTPPNQLVQESHAHH
jgi:hypothetical protein